MYGSCLQLGDISNFSRSIRVLGVGSVIICDVNSIIRLDSEMTLNDFFEESI